ncbi:DNA-binding response regulator [Paenibacillus agaridevorans]|uniref:DNA-binding response regulator n=1 Tax=Paenibacillus agaridevorans TaxID=171404 RepID=A0A2R5F2I8_9BACL|nr:response regulator [Paenibacillus agaridevorans]GBG10523.1 DNA-binding response regulator [Paenibacillus agaridevorans]
MWKLLLVEDEPFVLRSIRQAIDWEALGFEVVAEAEDGLEAWDYMQTHPVDVVVTDIMMPCMDGIELLRAAKDSAHEAEFVMLTCVNEFEYARQALQNGASGYLLKASMDPGELQTALQKVTWALTKKREQQSIGTMLELWNTESIPWKDEREIIQYFERGKWSECEQALKAVWAYMQDGQVPAELIIETANRLDKTFARITEQTPAGMSEWMKCESREQALDRLLERLRDYSKHKIKRKETDHPEINKIIAYVNSHYDKELTLKGMAKYVNMGEQYLSGLFKKKTGEQFIQYVLRIRIEWACHYLEETDLRVMEICERVGFVHLNYFLKQFKKWTGFTPSEFRDNKKAERMKLAEDKQKNNE